MQDRTKRIFIALCIIIPFLIYCVYYYAGMIKNAPYRFSDFESIELVYGYPDSMLNQYNSKTHKYQYLTKQGEVVKDTLKLRDDDLLYLHRKAMELGYWNVADDMTTPEDKRTTGARVPRYKLTFNYKEKSKSVTLDADYEGVQKMKDAAKTTIDEVLNMIATAKAR
ncbi:hypothetical protein [Sphingobacterium sp. BN32]|uniref:hypothetical protein n=1 Tax=Sphingobacterium sp. BN32 TaxID=3058432 RepID=UPI00265D31DC|nr:hypothetical protein [Sphingobacterium sp. BN32]WKK59259.1 hypothetical protein QYC40_03290 [Sphingobacterium sp. BN32]